MSEIIVFDGTRKRYSAKEPRPHVTENAVNRSFFGNQHTRRSVIRMFLCGGSIRSVGRKVPGGESAVEQELREALLDRGLAA